MLNHIFSLVLGCLLLLIGLVCCFIIIYFHFNSKLNEFTLITISDAISTIITGIFFILHYSYTFKISDICDINSVLIKFGMTMIPLINGFISTFILNYECSNYAKRQCQAKFKAKEKKSLILVPQWLIPIVSFIYLATLQPKQVFLRSINSYEQCELNPIFSTFHKTHCYINETNQFQFTNKYAVFPEKFINTLITGNIKYNITQNSKNINIQNETNEIVNNVYKLMSVFKNKSERNNSKRSDAITAQPIPYSQNLTQYIDFLTTALKIVHQRPAIQQMREKIDEISKYDTILSQPQGIIMYNGNTTILIDNEIKNDIRNNMSTSNNIFTNNTSIIAEENQLMNFLNFNSQNNLSNLFKLANPMDNNINDTNSNLNNTDCFMHCSVSNESLKHHFFILLFISYFIPICLTIFVYKNIKWEVTDADPQKDKHKLKESTKVIDKSRKMTVASLLLLSPSFIDVLLQTLLCLQIPEWMSTLFLLVIQVHNAVRNIFNISMVKICLDKKGNCGQVSPSIEETQTKEIEDNKAFKKATTQNASLETTTVAFEDIENENNTESS